MARTTGARQVRKTGDRIGDDDQTSHLLWQQKAGTAPGVTFMDNGILLRTGAAIPAEFLEAEARRDVRDFGRVIPMDSPEFKTLVLAPGLLFRLHDYWTTTKTDRTQSLRPLRAPAGSTAPEVKVMDGHPALGSPSSGRSSDVQLSDRAPGALEERFSRLSSTVSPMPSIASERAHPAVYDTAASLPVATTTITDSEHATTFHTRQTLQRGRGTPLDSRSRTQPGENAPWAPGAVALLDLRSANGGQRLVTVQVTAVNRAAEGEGYSSTDGGDRILVTDGAMEFPVATDELTKMEVARGLVARLQSGGCASPSGNDHPSSRPSEGDRWGWLTPVGLAQAETAAVPVPRGAVAHLVGRGGRTIRMIEDTIGVIIGITDGDDGRASVSLVGPQEMVAAARALIEAAVGGGVLSLLQRIQARGSLFV